MKSVLVALILFSVCACAGKPLRTESPGSLTVVAPAPAPVCPEPEQPKEDIYAELSQYPTYDQEMAVTQAREAGIKAMYDIMTDYFHRQCSTGACRFDWPDFDALGLLAGVKAGQK